MPTFTTRQRTVIAERFIPAKYADFLTFLSHNAPIGADDEVPTVEVSFEVENGYVIAKSVTFVDDMETPHTVDQGDWVVIDEDAIGVLSSEDFERYHLPAIAS